jgi:hypothetical protein
MYRVGTKEWKSYQEPAAPTRIATPGRGRAR